MKTIAYILIAGALTSTVLAAEVDVDSTYFHPAASLYIHGDTANASNLVARGLAQFPEDGKLRRLKELLEQQQEQNQDQQKQQDQNQQNQDQQKDQQQDQQDQNGQQQDQQNQQQDQNQDQQQDEPQQPEPQQAEQLSQDEAKRLLDAMKQEEENKRLQLRPVIGRPIKVDKDW